MRKKDTFKILFLTCLLVILCIGFSVTALAQTWEAIPPYNFLWPLWSPALSPVDPITGLKTPIVSTLTSSSFLSLQPGLAWNPIFDNPYLLYNSPLGLQYYDVVYGFNSWPPGYSIDPITGDPIPLNLPVGYQYLPPTDSTWLQQYVPTANLAYLQQYPTWAQIAYTSSLPPNLTGLDPWAASLAYPTPSFSSLLTVAQLLGYASVTSANIFTPPPTVAPPPITTTIPVTFTLFNPGAAILALGLLGLI